ncbi:MAG: 3-isopropylmalate dehydratase [Candidatus Jordarchaeales archaeon]|nr:3-isopropylmalate dehydratase small subunit [Candidatus Jordarchaeia archaeon]
MKIKGTVWKFGDNIDTDLITPGKYMDLPLEELKKHVLEVVNPEFAAKVKAGDVIIAGANFGCGSSRETAPQAIKALGVGAVVAESFARIFFRNAVAIGLPVISCSKVAEAFDNGDEAEVDIEKAEIRNITKGITLKATPLSEDIKNVILKGGIIPLLKELAEERRRKSQQGRIKQ